MITGILSAMALFWISIIGWGIFGTLPISITKLLIFAGVMSLLGVIFGLIFPKAMRILAFPFAFWGIGN